mmetsp:Transcript_26356/g.52957  ORF Transcript_26356/g.52957 Transcript_26356/m.52957 type:complete len:211 (+) Transcript_26356:860-1492(+)
MGVVWRRGAGAVGQSLGPGRPEAQGKRRQTRPVGHIGHDGGGWWWIVLLGTHLVSRRDPSADCVRHFRVRSAGFHSFACLLAAVAPFLEFESCRRRLGQLEEQGPLWQCVALCPPSRRRCRGCECVWGGGSGGGLRWGGGVPGNVPGWWVGLCEPQPDLCCRVPACVRTRAYSPVVGEEVVESVEEAGGLVGEWAGRGVWPGDERRGRAV